MSGIPQRASLLAQAVDSLRHGIAGGQWAEVLPPERVLCEQLGISRSTLRRAIDRIEEEGLVEEGRSGRRRRIIGKPDPSSLEHDTRRTRTIAWLTRQPLMEMPSVNLRLIAQLQNQLSTNGCQLKVVHVPGRTLADPDARMEDFLHEVSADVWILHWMPEEVQRWFYRHRPVACIVGSRAPGVELASIEVDSLAPMQHAVALLRQRGHRHIGLVRPARHLVGEDRLEETLRELSGGKSMATVLACPDEPARIAGEFKHLFAAKSGGGPSALICSIPNLALFALTWLQQHGIPVPGRVSLVVLRSQPILEFASPRLAHYAINEGRAVTRLLPRLLDLLQTGACATAHIGLTPDFVPGESLGKAR